MVKLAIVEDSIQFRELLNDNLKRQEEISLLFGCENGQEFLNCAEKEKELPDVVLMDVEMPVMDGIEAVEIAHKKYPNIIFIMFSVVDDEETLYKAISAGASGYLLKEEPTDSIAKHIVEAKEHGSVPFTPRMAKKAMEILRSAPVPVKTKENPILSEREIEVLQHLAEGKNSTEIGELMFLSYHTVRKHMSNIYAKLQVGSKAEAVKIGFRKRWLKF